MKTALSDARRERREAVEALVYEKAASARMREIALRSKLGESRAEWKRSLESNPVEITARHIQEVITAMTGIPAERVSDGEMIRLQTLREHLAKRVVGQQEAVEKISRTIRRSRAGLKDENRPIGVFLFVGPTGVGKTLLAKEVSKWLFDERRGLIRIDMSEYGEKHNVARLIGSPPGYVGYGEGGQLTEAVRRQPYAVVLFDEIEKAHPDVFNILLQVLDDGRLTDNKGRTVNFKNTIIIMTSNLGSQLIREDLEKHGGKLDSHEQSLLNNQLMTLLKKTIRPEFLNRIDDIIMFLPLTKEQIAGVVKLQMNAIRKMLEPQGFTLEYTDAAINWLADAGFDPEFGARPVKRAIQEYVLNDLSKKLLAEEVSREKPIIIDANGAGLVFRN